MAGLVRVRGAVLSVRMSVRGRVRARGTLGAAANPNPNQARGRVRDTLGAAGLGATLGAGAWGAL